MRLIFVTDELPRPDQAGHLAMNHAIIAWAQGAGHEVTVLLTGARLDRPAEHYDLAPVAGPEVVAFRGTVLAATPRAQARIAARRLGRFLPAKLAEMLRRRRREKNFGAADAVLGSFTTPAQAAWCARYIERARPDALLIDTIFRAPVLRALREGPRSVIIAHDLFHRRHLALTTAGYRVHPATLGAAEEGALLANAAAVVAIQPEEARLIAELCPSLAVVSAPMPALPCPRPAGLARLPGRLVFVGSASLPNVDGLRWFLDAVWPHLRRWRSEIMLDIVGACGAAFPRLPPDVRRLGQVKALSPVLHRATLAIAPLRVGSGLKIKLLDYARHGLITVATPAAIAGFAADPEAPFVTARTELGFAAAISRQLGGPAQDDRSLRYVERHYGVEKSFSGLAGVLNLTRDPVC